MLPLTEEQIRGLAEEDIETLSRYDAAGLLLRPGDTIGSFRERLLSLSEQLKKIDEELASPEGCRLFDGFSFCATERIPDEIMKESAEATETLFRFSANWAPGFFLSKSLGILWGGCTLSFPDTHLSVFIIRANFATSPKWFIYRRDELLAHELCHAARSPLGGDSFAEHFAYMTSTSILRRYLGNCFRRASDAFLFIVPVFVLLLAQLATTFTPLLLPIWPFWVIAALGPAFLLWRNHCDRKTYRRAEANLEKAGISNAKALLFRCTENEIRGIAKLGKDSAFLTEHLEKMSVSELRWRIIKHRFIDKTHRMEVLPHDTTIEA